MKTLLKKILMGSLIFTLADFWYPRPLRADRKNLAFDLTGSTHGSSWIAHTWWSALRLRKLIERNQFLADVQVSLLLDARARKVLQDLYRKDVMESENSPALPKSRWRLIRAPENEDQIRLPEGSHYLFEFSDGSRLHPSLLKKELKDRLRSKRHFWSSSFFNDSHQEEFLWGEDKQAFLAGPGLGPQQAGVSTPPELDELLLLPREKRAGYLAHSLDALAKEIEPQRLARLKSLFALTHKSQATQNVLHVSFLSGLPPSFLPESIHELNGSPLQQALKKQVAAFVKLLTKKSAKSGPILLVIPHGEELIRQYLPDQEAVFLSLDAQAPASQITEQLQTSCRKLYVLPLTQCHYFPILGFLSLVDLPILLSDHPLLPSAIRLQLNALPLLSDRPQPLLEALFQNTNSMERKLLQQAYPPQETYNAPLNLNQEGAFEQLLALFDQQLILTEETFSQLSSPTTPEGSLAPLMLNPPLTRGQKIMQKIALQTQEFADFLYQVIGTVEQYHSFLPQSPKQEPVLLQAFFQGLSGQLNLNSLTYSLLKDALSEQVLSLEFAEAQQKRLQSPLWRQASLKPGNLEPLETPEPALGSDAPYDGEASAQLLRGLADDQPGNGADTQVKKKGSFRSWLRKLSADVLETEDAVDLQALTF